MSPALGPLFQCLAIYETLKREREGVSTRESGEHVRMHARHVHCFRGNAADKQCSEQA